MAGLTKNKSKFEEYYKLPPCHKLIMVSSAHFRGTHWVSSWYLHAPRQILWFHVGAHYWNLNFWVPFKIHLETKFWDGFPSKLIVGSILIWVKFYTVLLWRGIFFFFIFWTINKEQVFNIIIVDFFFFFVILKNRTHRHPLTHPRPCPFAVLFYLFEVNSKFKWLSK